MVTSVRYEAVVAKGRVLSSILRMLIILIECLRLDLLYLIVQVRSSFGAILSHAPPQYFGMLRRTGVCKTLPQNADHSTLSAIFGCALTRSVFELGPAAAEVPNSACALTLMSV